MKDGILPMPSRDLSEKALVDVMTKLSAITPSMGFKPDMVWVKKRPPEGWFNVRLSSIGPEDTPEVDVPLDEYLLLVTRKED